MTFKNKQGISKIVFSPKFPCHNECPLGQLVCDAEAKAKGKEPKKAHYTNNFTVTFIPNRVICDYCDIEAWIAENLNDKLLIIEDVVEKLFTYIYDTYKPKYLRVESFVQDAIHGPVTVTKETQK